MLDIKLTPAKSTDAEFGYLEEAMKIHFPDNERMPISMIKKAVQKDILHIYFLTDGINNLGYVIIQPLSDSKIVYIHYLAIHENYRGEGYGSIILTMLKKLMTDCIFLLEVEDPNFANGYEDSKIRKNRLEFYYKNGFNMINSTSLNLFGAKMKLMATKRICVKNWNLFVKKVYFDVSESLLMTVFIHTE